MGCSTSGNSCWKSIFLCRTAKPLNPEFPPNYNPVIVQSSEEESDTGRQKLSTRKTVHAPSVDESEKLKKKYGYLDCSIVNQKEMKNLDKVEEVRHKILQGFRTYAALCEETDMPEWRDITQLEAPSSNGNRR